MATSNNIKKSNAAIFPFFVGCDRSGTTLFRAIFDSHPEMAIPGESFFIVPMARQRKLYENHLGFSNELFVSDLFKYSSFCKWNISKESVMKLLTEIPPETYTDAVRRVFFLYAQIQGKSRYGDKTPKYVCDIPILAKLFPEARFIHIIRDGRNVALSIQEIGIKSGLFRFRNIGECAIHWRERVERGRKAGRQIGSERYLEVCYENLVEYPERTVRSLCEFIDLKFHNGMLQYFERANELVASFKNPLIQRNLFLPLTKNLRDWRHQMSKKDLALFEILAGSLLSELGYERVLDKHGLMINLNIYTQGFILQTRNLIYPILEKLMKWIKTVINIY